MLVKLSIRIPSGSARAVSDKVSGAYARAMARAGTRVQDLVVERVSAAADKLAPGFAPRYRAAIRARGAVTVTDRAVTVAVTDPVVVAAERGASAFDMKAKLLARGKPSKGGGVYVDVPIHHKAGQVPQHIRTAMRRAARVVGGVGVVRRAAVTEGRSFSRELHRGPAAQALGVPPRRQDVRHKRGIHDDLVRTSSRTSGGGWSASYSTVRRISSRSSSTSWHHPGFKAHHVLDQVLAGARRDVAAIVKDALSSSRST